MANELLAQLGIVHPIIQAPMGGANATPPALVAAVSNAGGLGSIGAAYMSPAQIARECAETRALTSKPFGINLFAPTPIPHLPRDVSVALGRLAPLHADLGIAPPAVPELPAFSFDDQFRAVLESDARVFSFTFGALSPSQIAEAKSRGKFVVGTATTVEEATTLERGGVDAIATQGSEAGGHRGTFLGTFEASMIGTMALVPQIVDAVRVPSLRRAESWTAAVSSPP